MSGQLAALVRNAKNYAEHAAASQEYTIVKEIVSIVMEPREASAFLREMSEKSPDDPLGWFYDVVPFPYDIKPCPRESRLVDVICNTKKTTPWKVFKDAMEAFDTVAVVFKPTDYAVFMVLHNYDNAVNSGLEADGDWIMEIKCRKHTLILQSLKMLVRNLQ